MVVKTKPRIAVVVALVVVLGLILAGFTWVRVCDEQVGGGGRVVTVCRHLATTDPPVVVLGVLALVLLSAFYAEISGFGVTLKRQVAEIDRRTRENERTATALEETVDDLAEFNRERVTDRALVADDWVPDPRITPLARQYNILRWTMRSGRERTRRMTEVVERLRTLLRDVTDFDVLGHLRADDRGVRLAAYAYVRDHVVPDVLAPLVAAATTEEKPFGQYTALRAVLHQIDAGERLEEHDRRMLMAMRDRVGADTDRGVLITAILG